MALQAKSNRRQIANGTTESREGTDCKVTPTKEASSLIKVAKLKLYPSPFESLN